MKTKLIRINKYIADCGVSSRRKAEEYVLSGRIKVNGKIIEDLAFKVDLAKDYVKLDHKNLKYPHENKLLVLALNKPAKCISTLFDPQGRETIAHHLPKGLPRLYPVGRLDYDTEGLILVTNNGELANQIMHPSYEIFKTYLVKVKGFLEATDIKMIEDGFKLRGKQTAPAKIKLIKSLTDKAWYELTLYEGRNHQIKETFFDLGKRVLKIKRVKVANIELGDLKIGECKALSPAELADLKKLLKKQTLKNR